MEQPMRQKQTARRGGGNRRGGRDSGRGRGREGAPAQPPVAYAVSAFVRVGERTPVLGQVIHALDSNPTPRVHRIGTTYTDVRVPDTRPDWLKPLPERCRSFLRANEDLNKSPYRQMLTRLSPRVNMISFYDSPLYDSVMESWIEAEPNEDERHGILDLLDKLTDMVNERFSTGRGLSDRYVVDVFGSVSWGGETGENSDLDLVVIDRFNPQGYTPDIWRVPPGETPSRSIRRPQPIPSLPAIYKLYPLAGGLKSLGMEVDDRVVWATTPIVKFKDPETLKECDICVNDMGGWYNSSLILHYCQLSPNLLRPMIHALKLWANAYNLNNPSGENGPATMSSYCLTLMAIAYLQRIGELPNLQANVRAPIPGDAAQTGPNVIWVGFGKSQGIKCHVGFDETPRSTWSESDHIMGVDSALEGFFNYFDNDFGAPVSKHQFSYYNQIVSVVQGGMPDRAQPMGHWARTEQAVRQRFKEMGYPDKDIAQLMSDQRKQRDQLIAREMGKGDRGYHPRQWDEKRLIVQDPFLWEKNCAGGMSAVGLDMFRIAVRETAKLLKQSPHVDLFDLLHIESITSHPKFIKAAEHSVRLEERKQARQSTVAGNNGSRTKQTARRGGGTGGRGGRVDIF